MRTLAAPATRRENYLAFRDVIGAPTPLFLQYTQPKETHVAMNSGRILGGGLLAGLVINIIDAVGNVALLGPRWQSETEAIKPGLYAAAGQSSMVGWITTDFLLGFLIIWLYAAIRPRFGPGSRTAAVAAVTIWFATRAYFASYIFLGFFSTGLIGIASFIALVAMVAGAWAGGRVYQE